MSYSRANDQEINFICFQQLLGTIRTILRKVKTETVIKFYDATAVSVLQDSSETLMFLQPARRDG